MKTGSHLLKNDFVFFCTQEENSIRFSIPAVFHWALQKAFGLVLALKKQVTLSTLVFCLFAFLFVLFLIVVVHLFNFYSIFIFIKNRDFFSIQYIPVMDLLSPNLPPLNPYLFCLLLENITTKIIIIIIIIIKRRRRRRKGRGKRRGKIKQK